ncbi:MAG: twin-arginine translocation signal domain-containing protein [Acidimicrobiales bacterium]
MDGLAEVLGRRTTRRRVMQRAAVAGAALTVAPGSFVLRPGTAYAAICGCSGQSCDCLSTCCDGYTEFCCTTSGVNRCPPNTLLGGWWKVDGSSFCGGGPRYYLDCNAQCGSCGCGASGICSGTCSGTRCGCANGSCGNRKTGCTGFRYGQCHQDVPCLGPIVCRVVTCTPPWQLDGSCGTSSRTDNNTRNHNRSCLQGAPVGSLELIQSVPGGVRLAGWAADPDLQGPTEVHAYIGGGGYNLGPANKQRDDVAAFFPALGGAHGFDVVVPDLRDGSVEVCVYAINLSGPSGHTLLGCRQVSLVRGPFGALELVGWTANGVRVAGWAIDPDTSNPVEVHAYAGPSGVNLGLADDPRPDVGAAYPGYGSAHGFSGVVAFSGPGPVDVCAYGLNAAGAGGTTTIGCRRFEAPHGPLGNVESVSRVPGGIRVQGWALDPDTTAPIEVHIYAGGGGTNTGLAQSPRPDVGAAYPGFGDAHGFDAVIAWSGGGRVELCAYGINVGSGANTLIGCRSLEFMSSPFGSLEVLARSGSGLRVAGWAIDPDTADPIEVHVYVNGGGTNLGPSNLGRPDVASVYPGYGPNHGFDRTIPSVGSAPLNVCVYGINSGAGSNVLFGCWQLA